MEIVPFKNQDYESLLNSHDSDNLFEDPLFPCSDKSMYFSQKPPRGVVWRRPKEVRPRAKFVVNGYDRCDMDQGYIGNCWFIAGCVGILQAPKLFAKVVPEDQSFDENYAGIFHFRFWLYGQWVDVVIDDRLPFFTDGRLVFAHNKQQPDEFWASLLEKAYAKLYGSYESLEAGQTTDALIDMSGGLEESFDLTKMDRNEKAQLWQILFQGYKKNSIMGCSITPDPRQKEAKLANGLVMGHAYTITKLVSFEHRGRVTQLIRIRNPWGNEVEWKGDWSDNSREWNTVSSDIKEEIGLVKDADGEFWMGFGDFVSNWHTVQICHLSAESFSDELSSALENMSWRKIASDGESSWKTSIYHSEWVRGKTAGGSGQGNMAKYWTNPQFLIRVNDVDLYDSENKATLIIALMQKDSRLKRIKTKADSAEEFIQFRLYKIRDDDQIDDSKATGLKFYSNQLERIGASGSYINSREVTKRFRLEPGYYLIIPSTYEDDKSCEFMVRILTEEAIEANSLDQDKEDLTEEESFFELEDTDSLFSSWDNFLKAAGENVGEDEEQHAASSTQSSQRRADAKETCSLM